MENCKTGNIFIQYFVSFFLECTNNQVHHITRSTTRHSRDTVRITQSQLIKFGSIVLQFSIIGKQGKALKKVATEARRDLERFFGKTIFLETFVKVDKDWRSSDKELRNFGYQLD